MTGNVGWLVACDWLNRLIAIEQAALDTNGGGTSYSVWEWNMVNGRDGYDETEYMGEENITKDIRTGGTARNVESKN